MLYAILILSFISVFLIVRLILVRLLRDKISLQSRLDNVGRMGSRNSEDNELNQSLGVRILRPLLDNVSKNVMKVTPSGIISSMEKKLSMAGSSTKLNVKDMINIQVALVVGLPVITGFLGFYLSLSSQALVYLIIIEIAIGLVMPNFGLSRKITERQKKIQNSLADVLDLLTVSVEAGLGFDGALAKVIDKMPGPLADEFDTVLQEIRVGRLKRDALRDMADRICIQDFSTFVSSIIQADQFGVSIANVLRIQSEQIRQKRRQRAQEKAMKAPIKMIIPMVVFIFPTLFGVLLGPVVIQLMGAFAK